MTVNIRKSDSLAACVLNNESSGELTRMNSISALAQVTIAHLKEGLKTFNDVITFLNQFPYEWNLN